MVIECVGIFFFQVNVEMNDLKWIFRLFGCERYVYQGWEVSLGKGDNGSYKYRVVLLVLESSGFKFFLI